MKEITDQNYWEQYYAKSNTNKKNIISICEAYKSFWDLLFTSKKYHQDSKPELIEIGGHPGRYLAYLAHVYNVRPTSLDFNSDRTKIDDSMNSFGVKDYNVIQADLLKYNNHKLYDYVISNGFIEHFDNFEKIMDLHLKFLKPKGKLLIMIPNKRFYKWLYQSVLDRENLKQHNLECMKLSVFKDFAKRNNLNIVKLGYYGGFQFGVHYKPTGVKKFIIDWHERIFGKIINPYLKKSPSKYLSNTIIGVFQYGNNSIETSFN